MHFRKKAWASDVTDHFFDACRCGIWDILGEEDREDICDAEESEE
jgi:hypothetical protein